jgi:response regulator RpfG family c-di-GMP phosphodiesterase
MRSTQFDQLLVGLFLEAQGGRHIEPTLRQEHVLKTCTVMCIDDRPLWSELRKSVLASPGFCIKAASNGCEAMKMLEQT